MVLNRKLLPLLPSFLGARQPGEVLKTYKFTNVLLCSTLDFLSTAPTAIFKFTPNMSALKAELLAYAQLARVHMFPVGTDLVFLPAGGLSFSRPIVPAWLTLYPKRGRSDLRRSALAFRALIS